MENFSKLTFPPSDNVLIGEGNVSVRMLEVEEDHDTDTLPFPHAGADNLGETVGGLVRWAKSNIQKVGCMWETGRSSGGELFGMPIGSRGMNDPPNSNPNECGFHTTAILVYATSATFLP